MSKWGGFDRIDFCFEGHECIVVKPDKAAERCPWVWRAEFFGAFSAADEEMVRCGWHIAYVALSDRYGCPSAVQDMERFRAYVVRAFGLHEKAQLFGFSRGGLYAVNYALTYPQYVDKLYLDAPVLDIRSWPGGKGKGVGAPREWEACKGCYALTEESAASFAGNPLDRVEELAALCIPVIMVAGGNDEVVPFEENGELFARRFEAAGGTIQVIVKPDCGHHPHSLTDPTPIAQFLKENT